MGAHTLGRSWPPSVSTLPSNVLSLFRMTHSHSLLKYTWTVRGGHIFNNAYYKNIVRKTDWFIESQVATLSLFSVQYNLCSPCPGRKDLQPGGGRARQLAGHQVGAHHERLHQERRPHALDQVNGYCYH